MPLTPPQRSFLLADALGATVFNLLLNALLGWLMFRGAPHVSVWGDPGLVLDLSATALILPFLLCLITSTLVRRRQRAGKVGALDVATSEHALLSWLPRSLVLRALLLGVLSLLLVGSSVALFMRALGTTHVSLLAFVAAKAGLSALLSALTAPLSALHVLAQQPAARSA